MSWPRLRLRRAEARWPLRRASGVRLSWVLPGGVAQLAERYVRNVEAVGSNPITSTERPSSEAQSGIPQIFIWVDMSLSDLIGEKTAVAELKQATLPG